MRLWVLLSLILLPGSPVTGQEVPLPQQLATAQRDQDKLRVLLDRTQTDYDRCKQDLAELWVQGREVTMKYQQLLKVPGQNPAAVLTVTPPTGEGTGVAPAP